VRRLLDYRGPRRAFRNEVACDNASRRRAPVRDGVDITDTFGPALPRFHDPLAAGLHQGHFAGDHRYHDGAAMHVIWNAASGRQVENLIDQFVVASGDRNWERLQHDVDRRGGIGLRLSRAQINAASRSGRITCSSHICFCAIFHSLSLCRLLVDYAALHESAFGTKRTFHD